MTKFILDTDIGTDVDDALALAYVMAHPDVELIGVTTVHANAPLRARIARKLLDLGGHEGVPVIAGRSTPLRASTVENFHWHQMWGHEGVGLLEDPTADLDPDPHRDDAAQFILEQTSAYPGEIHLLTVGPVTNVGRALELDPTLASRVGPVTLMGGLVDKSLVPWSAHFETNLNADPGAAELVLRSNMQMTLVPLEVTLQVFLTASDRAKLANSGRPVPLALERLIAAMREPFLAFHDRYGLDGSHFDQRTYLHDPLAAYVALGGEHAKVRQAHVTVEYQGDILRTMDHAGEAPNMNVCLTADGAAFVKDWLDIVIAH